MRTKISYDMMMQQLVQMSKEEIQRHLLELGCSWNYEKIQCELEMTYNDLSISDRIFEVCFIHDEDSAYSKSFIDEAILEIAKRESFSFIHYGIISYSIVNTMNSTVDRIKQVDELEELFRSLFKTAKKFKIDSLETMVYQINDGVDMMSVIAHLLDSMMSLGRVNEVYYRRITGFVDKYLAIFPKTSDLVCVMLQYEQAQAYIALKSKKGEQMFQHLLTTHSDITDVVLHYALAYIDDDEPKALKIIQRYANVIDKKSESYQILCDISEDCKKTNAR